MKHKILKWILLVTAIALLLGVAFSITIFSYYTLESAAVSLKEFADDRYNREISSSISIPEIQSKLNNGEVYTIAVISSSGIVVASNGKFDELGTNLREEKGFNAAIQDDSYTVLEKKNKDAFLRYYVYVEVLPSVDTAGFVVVAYGTPVNVNNSNFWRAVILSCIGIIAFVLLSYVILNGYMHSALQPIEQIHKLLENINNGEYYEVKMGFDTPEFIKAENEINKISKNISETLKQMKYEQKKATFLLQSIEQGVIALAVDGSVMLNNDAILKIFNLDHNIVGIDIGYILDDVKVVDAIRLALVGTQTSSYEMKVDERCYRVEMARIDEEWFEDMRGVAMLVLFTDITEEVKSADIRSEFFANASHELKTPLTVIRGYSEMLKSGNLPPAKIEKCAAAISNNAEKMQSLISDMLKLSRMDAKIDIEEFVMLDLAPIVESVVLNIREESDKRNITVKTRGNAKIMARPTQLTTLIKNLVDNAIKYSVDGGRVEVVVKENDDSVELSVKDNGVGIAKEHIDRIFERFYRADSGRTNADKQSTGLGLAIVKHIAQEHNANIEVKSVVGKGSTFTVRFKKD